MRVDGYRNIHAGEITEVECERISCVDAINFSLLLVTHTFHNINTHTFHNINTHTNTCVYMYNGSGNWVSVTYSHSRRQTERM